MSNFSWINEVAELSPAALTVRAQTISPNDDGMLKWDMFFPRTNVESVDMEDITNLDFRPASDRREWNQRGRLIPSKTPTRRKLSLVPVEGYYKWGEYELQKLNERTAGNGEMIARIMQTTVPGKVEQITQSNWRRVELDAFEAWAMGTVTQRNPQNAAETYVASFGFDSARMQTAGTAWNDAGQNAYNNLIDWLEDAIDAIGSVRGIVSRLNFVKEVVADAPTPTGAFPLTRYNIADRISQEIGQPFQFYVMEDTVEVFTDGGTATASTKVWPAEKVAAVPAGVRVGNTAFAPVIRAFEIARQLPQANVDVNGQTVFYEEHNNGRELSVEVQVNPLTVPNESLLYTIDVGF
jgi:hypothetical protein